MKDDFTKEPWIKVPKVSYAFNQACNRPKKEVEKPVPKLEYRPPSLGLAPGGGHQIQPAQVSPGLRRDEKARELKEAMRIRREFNRVSRDGLER